MAHFARVTSIVLLTAAAALLGVCGPASAGGRPIFYSTIDAGTGRAHVWEMDADGSNRHQVTTDDASQQYSPSLSPDGEVVAYSSAIGSNQQVFTEPIGGGMIDDISNGTGSMVSESPSYCGDGSIVYLGDHAGNGLWDVYRGGVDVVDTQWPGPGGHAQAEYTENDVRCSRTGELSFVRYADAAHPLPSPDHGGSLTVELWTRGPGDPDVGVERTFLNATGTQQITTVKHASWSPDGNRIAFIATTQADGGDQLFTMRSDGADVTRVEDTAGGGTPRGVAWSPDGTQVAYVRSDGEIEEVTLAGDVDTEIADVTATGGLSWGGPAPPAGVPISEPAPALPTPPGATPVTPVTPGTPVTATPLALVATAGTPSAKATTLAAVRAHGLATTLTCNEACAARGELLVTAAQAKRLGLLAKRSKAKAPVVLGTGQATRTAAGAFVLTIKLSAKARRALKHARTLRLTQTITVTGGAGKPVVRTRAVTLKAS